MTAPIDYADPGPTRAEIDALAGPVVVEFGTPWCGFCRAAQPLITAALAEHPQVRHIKVEDGRGRPLGRSFGVKLWPTLVFMDQGQEVARVVRPADQDVLAQALAQQARGTPQP
jgi:thioredoxin 1